MHLKIYLTSYFVTCALAFDQSYYRLDNAKQYFEEFITTYGKNYASVAEKHTRFQIFKENLKRINHFNYLNRSSKIIQGVTQFSDLTTEEFSDQYNSCLAPFQGRQDACQQITDAHITTNKAPQSLDYRQKNAVSSVKDQNPCQCCWAFATVGSLEGAYGIKIGQSISLSAQQLMDCLKCSGHCAKGSFMTSALSELKYLPGVMSDTDYPYVGKDLECQSEQSKAQVRVTGCLNFNLQSEEKLKEALATYGPIAIGIDSAPISHHVGGIVSAATCPPGGKIGHAVLLIGYGTEGGQDYWLIKNSWGSNWGEQGYVKFARGQNVCNMMNSYAAAGTIA